MNFNKQALDAATKAVKESFVDRDMLIGEQVHVVFKDSSLLYTMELKNGERNLKIEVNPEKPIMLRYYSLFE